MATMVSHPVNLNMAIFPVDGQEHSHELDPAKLIDQLPNDIKRITEPLVIRFRSDVLSCDVDYNMFMSKNHRISGDILSVGYRRFTMTDLSIELIYKLEIEYIPV